MIAINENPKLLIIAGPNGSGKTSVTERILKHEWIEGCEYINPDNIARDIFGDWNSPNAVMKAVRYAADMRAYGARHHFLVPGTIFCPKKRRMPLSIRLDCLFKL